MSAAPGRGEQMVAWSLAAVASVLAVGGSLLNLYGRIPLLASISTQGTALCLAVDGGATTGEVSSRLTAS